VLDWDTEDYDPKLLHAASASTLITITTPGVYTGGVYVGWEGNNVNSRFLEIQKNLTDSLARDRRVGTGASEVSLVLPDVALVAGDTLRVRVFQDSGGPLDVTTVNGSPVFWLRKIA
jgi:hypothetical protein